MPTDKFAAQQLLPSRALVFQATPAFTLYGVVLLCAYCVPVQNCSLRTVVVATSIPPHLTQSSAVHPQASPSQFTSRLPMFLWSSAATNKPINIWQSQRCLYLLVLKRETFLGVRAQTIKCDLHVQSANLLTSNWCDCSWSQSSLWRCWIFSVPLVRRRWSNNFSASLFQLSDNDTCCPHGGYTGSITYSIAEFCECRRNVMSFICNF